MDMEYMPLTQVLNLSAVAHRISREQNEALKRKFPYG